MHFSNWWTKQRRKERDRTKSKLRADDEENEIAAKKGKGETYEERMCNIGGGGDKNKLVMRSLRHKMRRSRQFVRPPASLISKITQRISTKFGTASRHEDLCDEFHCSSYPLNTKPNLYGVVIKGLPVFSKATCCTIN
jgi:hypothetical protein